jgi:hypothetical protein
MQPIVKEVWTLARDSKWDEPRARLADARAIWNAHQYKATWSAFHVAVFTVKKMAGGTEEQPVAVWPQAVPHSVLNVLGDRSRANNAAQAAWDVIAGALTSVNVDVNDPFLEDQLKVVSRDFKGSGVYLYTYWSSTALRVLEQKPDAEQHIVELGAEIRQLGHRG